MTRPLPPGPAGDRLTGNLADFSADPLGFLTDSVRRYGDVVSLSPRNVLLADPGDIERLLVDRDGDFVKVTERMRRSGRRPGFPHAMMNSDGADWQGKRRRVQPAFGRRLLDATAAAALTEAEHAIARWRPGERRDLHREISPVTLRTVTKLMFGVLLDEPDVAVVARLVAAIMDLSASPIALPEWVPAPVTVRLRRATKELGRMLDRLRNQVAAGPSGVNPDSAPVLHALLTADPVPSPGELRDELATLVMSGYETTTDAVVWACSLLARDPAAARQVAAEADSALGAGRPAPLDALSYTHAVVRETLRLYPPAWITGREAVREVEFQGYAIPAGTTVAVSQWVTHRDPRLYDRPEDFFPDRWLDGHQHSLPRGAYFPFGLGPRACIGASVAMTEAVVIVAAIWRRYRLAFTDGADVRPRAALALQPAGATFRLVARDERT